MSIDLIKALKSPWQKDGGFARMLLGGLVLAVPILWFVALGYLIEYLNKMINGKEELGSLFAHGSKSFIIGFKYFIGLILLIIPFAIFDFIIKTMIGESNPIIYWIIFNFLQIVFMIICFMMTINFALDYKVFSMVDFQRASLILKDNVGPFIIAFIFNALVQFVYMIPLIIGCIILPVIAAMFIVMPIIPLIFVLILIVMAITLLFSSLVASFNVIGQFAKESPAIEEMKRIAAV